MMAAFQTLYGYFGVLLDSRTIFLALLGFLLLAWIAQNYLNQATNPPPGPKAWPVVGCIPQLLLMTLNAKPRTMQRLFHLLHQKYGPVCSLPLPLGKRMVIISGYKAVHESLTNPELNQRPPLPKSQSEELFNGEGECQIGVMLQYSTNTPISLLFPFPCSKDHRIRQFSYFQFNYH